MAQLQREPGVDLRLGYELWMSICVNIAIPAVDTASPAASRVRNLIRAISCGAMVAPTRVAAAMGRKSNPVLSAE
jgi:hypothetical protein